MARRSSVLDALVQRLDSIETVYRGEGESRTVKHMASPVTIERELRMDALLAAAKPEGVEIITQEEGEDVPAYYKRLKDHLSSNYPQFDYIGFLRNANLFSKKEQQEAVQNHLTAAALINLARLEGDAGRLDSTAN